MLQVNDSKHILQGFYTNYSDYFKKAEDHENSKNSAVTTINSKKSSSPSYNHHKIKHSYEKIDNEFQKIEKITKDLNIMRKTNENVKTNRVKLLESKLQGFCDEIKNLRLFDPSNTSNNNVENINNSNNYDDSKTYLYDINKNNKGINDNSSMPSIDNSSIISDKKSQNTKLTKIRNINKSVSPYAKNNKSNKLVSNNSSKNQSYSKMESELNSHSRISSEMNENNLVLMEQIGKLNVANKNELITLIETLMIKETNSSNVNYSKYEAIDSKGTIRKDN